ncbi:MAG: penicillin-binding protein activator LpoB, partial [Treponema sp.]|nr:penicillin-binding protein activator LpoB [Treponema sp.]
MYPSPFSNPLLRRGRVLCTLTLLFALTASVEAKDTLAILPFTGAQGEDGETIAELFSFQKDLTALFSPVPRTSINRAIRSEQGFQMQSGMTDPDTIASLGRQLGAAYVVAGTVTTLGSQNLLVIAILHTETLQQIAGDIQTYKTIEEIDAKLPAMARNIAAAVQKDTSKLPLLALPPVQMGGGADSREADTLAQILAVHLVQSGAYAVYPRTKSLDQVQEEYGVQFNGDTADEYLPSLGKATNPRLVLSVTARRLGSRSMFNAAVINLETGVQEAGDTVNYQNLSDGMDAMEELALKLMDPKKAAELVAAREATARAWAEQEAAAKARAEREVTERVWIVSDAASFTRAIAAINSDTRDGEYTITLSNSFTSGPVAFTNNTSKTITLKGDASVRTILNKGGGHLFTVPPGITLVLENNVTLNGNNQKNSLVSVNGGTLNLKAGSTIRG